MTKSLLDNAVTGTLLANFSVITSDGLPFSGILTPDPVGTVKVAGTTQLVLARNLTSADIGSHTWGVTASQNGQSASGSVQVQVAAHVTPPPLPVPKSISLTPANLSINDTTAAGTVLCTVSVTMTDGSVFAGGLSVDNSLVKVNGLTLVLDHGLSAGDDGAHNITVTVTQNSVSLNSVFALTITHTADQTPVTWNPSDNSNATLTNHNLTAGFNTSVDTWRSVRSTNASPKRIGKLHWETTIDAVDPGNGWGTGIMDGTADLNSYAGHDSHGIMFTPEPTQSRSDVYQNGASINNYPFVPRVGDVIAAEIDIDNKLIWWQDVTQGSGWTNASNGTLTGNPGTGVGGTAFTLTTTGGVMLTASGSYRSSRPDQQTINPGPNFVGAVSSGFSAWDTIGIPPTPRPIPLSIVLTPSSLQLFDNATIGTSLCTASVMMSDASVFSGVLSTNSSLVAVSGLNLSLSRGLSAGDDGVSNITVKAVQNGVTVSAGFALTVVAVVVTPPGDGPAAQWTLAQNSISGNTVTDTSGNSHTGTVGNGPLSFTVSTSGADFSGSQYIDIPFQINFANLTTSAWLYANDFNGNPRIVANSHTDSDARGFQLMINSGGFSGSFNVGNGTGYGNTTWSKQITTRTWHHYTGVYDGTAVIAYMDGVRVGTSPYAGGPIAASSQNVNIARNPAYSGDYFTGALSDVRVYQRALSASEVLALYQAGPPPTNVAQSGQTLPGSIFTFIPSPNYRFQPTERTVTGTVVLNGRFPSQLPPGGPSDYTFRYKFIDGGGVVRYGAYVTGMDWSLPYSFDSTSIPDGTYIYYPEFLVAPVSIDAMQPIGSALIIGNHGFSESPQMVPCVTAGLTASNRPNSCAPDFIMYDGVPNPVHTTYPIAYVPIPGASDPSSPYHSNPAALRDGLPGNWYCEIQTGYRNPEYIGNQQWATTKEGGVMVNTIVPVIISNQDSAYTQVLLDNPPDGTRLNSIIEPFTNFIEDPNRGGVWWGVNANGQVFTIDRSGNTETIVGFKRDRSVLTYKQFAYYDSEQPSEEEVDTKRIVVGNFVGDFDLGGAIDLCFDPRDSAKDTLYVVAQVDHFIAKIIVSSKTVTIYAGIPGTAGYREGAAASATFSSPTSIEMDNSGTLYISDPGNYAIRKITSPSLGVAGTVSTLCGGTVGPAHPTPTEAVGNQSASVTSITWNTNTSQGAVVLASSFTPPITLGTTLQFSPSLGDDGFGFPNGANYVVDTLNDSTHFTIKFMPDPHSKPNISNGIQSGSYTAVRYNSDIYSPPGTVGFSSAYVTGPQTLRLTSKGNLVLGESCYDTARLIALNSLNGPAANTITRIGCFSNHVERNDPPPIGAWLWLDVDKAGMCGPVDDIIINKMQDDFSAAHYNWRLSLSFTAIPGIPDYTSVFSFDGGPLPCYGPPSMVIGGMGHYPWAFSMSRLEGRMISNGIAMFHPTHWRIKQPSDQGVDFEHNFNNGVWSNGYGIHYTGTVPGFPGGVRPAFSHLWGNNGAPWIGSREVNTFEDIMATYPSSTPGDAGDVALGRYIQAGMGGGVPRPEITGNDLRDYIYYIRRCTYQSGVGATITTPGATITDNTTLVITNLTAVRSPATVLTLTWNTSKPTIGIGGAGDATQVLNFGCYPFRSPIESAYGTTHSVQIPVPATVTPLYFSAVARDLAGNIVHTDKQIISGSGGGGDFSPDGTIIRGSSSGGSEGGVTLKMPYGTLSLGQVGIPSPNSSGSAGPCNQPLLNGVPIAPRNKLGEGNDPAFADLRVAWGGNVFGTNLNQIWYEFRAYSWQGNGGADYASGPANPVPEIQIPTWSPPYTPSPEGTTINGPMGSVTTAEGIWTFGRALTPGWALQLNGVEVGISNIQPFIPADIIKVHGHGQLFFHNAQNNNWYTWAVHQENISPGGPTALPIPINIHLNPLRSDIPPGSPVGTFVTAVSITMSDGSPFAGTYALTDAGSLALGMSGNNVILTAVDPDHHYYIPVITATQNGCTISQSWSFSL